MFSYFTLHVASSKDDDQTHLCWSVFILINNNSKQQKGAIQSALLILQDKIVKLWVYDFFYHFNHVFEV